MERSARVEWNLGSRAPGEVQVHFSDDLDPEENLKRVLEILQGEHGMELEEIRVAVRKVFGEGEGSLFKGSVEEWLNAVMEANEEMSQP